MVVFCHLFGTTLFKHVVLCYLCPVFVHVSAFSSPEIFCSLVRFRLLFTCASITTRPLFWGNFPFEFFHFALPACSTRYQEVSHIESVRQHGILLTSRWPPKLSYPGWAKRLDQKLPGLGKLGTPRLLSVVWANIPGPGCGMWDVCVICRVIQPLSRVLTQSHFRRLVPRTSQDGRCIFSPSQPRRCWLSVKCSVAQARLPALPI